MKRLDWLFAAILVGMGIVCLTVSATSLLERPAEAYVKTLLTLTVWVGAPLVLFGSIYFIISRKKKKAEAGKESRNIKFKK